MPAVPASWEAEIPGLKYKDLPGKKPVTISKNKEQTQVWYFTSVIPATQEAWAQRVQSEVNPGCSNHKFLIQIPVPPIKREKSFCCMGSGR
jgi:hypothetical protein